MLNSSSKVCQTQEQKSSHSIDMRWKTAPYNTALKKALCMPTAPNNHVLIK